ncbi:GNAT family N-acetyltransferase [Paenibacillus sp. SYP-B3998]|uniref:GNAT family N-acetyltransferase n=1 Tax=Paenibacillus sp. SYP-B3998 TaxID=2678564 RepID=A0A6G3ZYH7_9BACL|nr:GNAT family N-acetyltransferase [Paenibacillus sp. SYP-B3998]NEW06631.1 GNAT family N-acetyltransferase [Paenibacillus sp. SYP-B3998]
MSLNIQLVSYTNPLLLELISKLDEDLMVRYPIEEIHFVDFNDPSVERITFAIVFEGEMPVGCGALRPFDTETTELKRFFVDKDYRNRGIASSLLAFLEKQALNAGYRIMRLETGAAQPEAIALYTKHGYYPIDPFGEYIGSKGSLCYEKRI